MDACDQAAAASSQFVDWQLLLRRVTMESSAGESGVLVQRWMFVIKQQL